MGEATKIRGMVENWIQGFGLDVGCGEDKIADNALGLDCRNLACVTICKKLDDLSLFGDGQFDFVFSSHFLEHIKNPTAMLSEMKRVLKKDGRIILYLPNPDKYKENNPEHMHLWRPTEFKKIIKNRFKQIKFDDKSFDYSYLYVGRK